MSSKYNRFLLTVCLPIMAVTGLISTPTRAGFEWTPPEEIKETFLPLEETLEPVAPEAVISEFLPEMDKTEEIIEEPAIQIKVLDDIAMEDEIDEAIENAIEIDDTNASEIIEEAQSAELEDQIEVIETETTEIIEIIKVEAPADIQDIKEEAGSTSLSINPYPLEENVKTPAETQAPIILSVNSDETLDEITETENTNTTEAQDKILWNETETFDVLEGFGSEMPLALALRQIVPAQYAFSFGKNVNPGTAISWTGGQPWNSVLEDALTPLNITFDLKGKKLLLHSVALVAITSVIDDAAIKEELSSVDVGDEIETIMDQVIATENEESISSVETIVIKDADHEQNAEISIPAQNLETKPLQDIAETAMEIPSAEPVDIMATEGVVQPVEIILKGKSTINDISVKRKTIQDPGQIEAKQPVIMEQLETIDVLEEKKKEVIIPSIEVEASILPVDSAVDYTEEDLITISEKKAITAEIVGAVSEKIEGNVSDEHVNMPEFLEPLEPIIAQEIIALDVPIIQETIIETEITDAVMPHVDIVAEENPSISSLRIKPSNTIEVWEASRKTNLHKVLSKWSKKENIELIWYTDESYILDKDIFISGTFKNAIDILFSKGLKNPPQYLLEDTPSYKLFISDSK